MAHPAPSPENSSSLSLPCCISCFYAQRAAAELAETDRENLDRILQLSRLFRQHRPWCSGTATMTLLKWLTTSPANSRGAIDWALMLPDPGSLSGRSSVGLLISPVWCEPPVLSGLAEGVAARTQVTWSRCWCSSLHHCQRSAFHRPGQMMKPALGSSPGRRSSCGRPVDACGCDLAPPGAKVVEGNLIGSGAICV